MRELPSKLPLVTPAAPPASAHRGWCCKPQPARIPPLSQPARPLIGWRVPLVGREGNRPIRAEFTHRVQEWKMIRSLVPAEVCSGDLSLSFYIFLSLAYVSVRVSNSFSLSPLSPLFLLAAASTVVYRKWILSKTIFSLYFRKNLTKQQRVRKAGASE